ncbi:MAG: putative endolysin [Prokaryotic dsDNA virus sp.]|nr:MAG: putative endolysin [Prokaryotic dsDNA virus sp.]|tara:strand:+ start:1215 stop:1619 length:405 start_codon:yes stop_codon:yes gene_type:complete
MSLLENIKESEGFRSRVYKCTEGYDTIGYGFAVKDLVMDKDIADMILERKVAELRLRVEQKFPFIDSMPESVQDVMIEMCFQLGVSGFSKFKKTIQYLMTKQFKEAAVEMLDSKWYKQTPNRAKKLSDIVKYAK